jgi:hypothetical protein
LLGVSSFPGRDDSEDDFASLVRKSEPVYTNIINNKISSTILNNLVHLLTETNHPH